MKRNILFIFLMIASLGLMTGCDKDNANTSNGGILSTKKTLVCSKENTDEEGYKTLENMEVVYKGTKVLSVKSTSTSETDPSIINFTLNIGKAMADKFSEIDGIYMNYEKVENNKIKITTEVDYKKIDINQMKEKLGSLFSEEDSLYSKNDITIDEFKANNLEGYTCK